MSKILDPILNIVRFHKKELVILLGLYLFFVYAFFSFNDLGDLVTAKVSEATQGQVSIDFDNLSFGLLPKPSLAMTKVKVETAFTQTIGADSIFVSPDLISFLAFRPGVNVTAEGFLGGTVDLSAAVSGKTQTQPSHHKQKISVDLARINLGSLSSLASLPLKVEGSLSGNMDSDVDPEFTEQPTGTIDIKSEKTIMPEGNITTPFGPIGLPRIGIGDVVFQGSSDKGQFEISKFTAGRQGGDLFANVTGHMDLKMIKTGANVIPQVGAYDLLVHLQIGDIIKQKLGAFLGILSNYQTANNVYAFRATAPNSYSPPNLTRLSQ